MCMPESLRATATLDAPACSRVDGAAKRLRPSRALDAGADQRFALLGTEQGRDARPAVRCRETICASAGSAGESERASAKIAAEPSSSIFVGKHSGGLRRKQGDLKHRRASGWGSQEFGSNGTSSLAFGSEDAGKTSLNGESPD